jgi:hypothetical protein
MVLPPIRKNRAADAIKRRQPNGGLYSFWITPQGGKALQFSMWEGILYTAGSSTAVVSSHNVIFYEYRLPVSQ